MAAALVGFGCSPATVTAPKLGLKPARSAAWMIDGAVRVWGSSSGHMELVISSEADFCVRWTDLRVARGAASEAYREAIADLEPAAESPEDPRVCAAYAEFLEGIEPEVKALNPPGSWRIVLVPSDSVQDALRTQSDAVVDEPENTNRWLDLIPERNQISAAVASAPRWDFRGFLDLVEDEWDAAEVAGAVCDGEPPEVASTLHFSEGELHLRVPETDRVNFRLSDVLLYDEDDPEVDHGGLNANGHFPLCDLSGL